MNNFYVVDESCECEELSEQELEELDDTYIKQQIGKLRSSIAHINMAAETIVAYHFIAPQSMKVSLDITWYEWPFGETEIIGRDLESIKRIVTEFSKSADKHKRYEAIKMVNSEIYYSYAARLTDSIAYCMWNPNDEELLENLLHFASPDCAFYKGDDIELANELYELVFGKQFKNEYFRKEIAKLRYFIEVNWDSIEKLSKVLIQKIDIEGDELNKELEKLEILPVV